MITIPSSAASLSGVTTPSLSLNFTTGTLDPRITFTRSSNGVSYGASANTVISEQNMYGVSTDMTQSGWNKGNITLVGNTTTAPDGTNTAATIVNTTANGIHGISQNSYGSTNTIYTLSVYLKANTSTYAYVGFQGAAGLCATVVVDLSAGTITETNLNSGGAFSGNPGIVSVGNGWYRISVSGLLNSLNPSIYHTVGIAKSSTGNIYSGGLPTYTGSTSDSIYIWGMQSEQRSQVTAYTPTVFAAISNTINVLQNSLTNVPRFDIDPVSANSKGLLIEEQRTNAYTYSQDFTQSAWSKGYSSVIGAAIVAPDGTQTAAKFIADASNNAHSLSNGGGGSAGTYTWSCYAKAGEYNQIQIEGNITGSVVWTLTGNGSTSNSSTSSITPVGNGWYRCVATITATGPFSVYILVYNSGNRVYIGNNINGIYIWGPQIELGSFATSYIPTPLVYSGRNSTATYLAANGYITTANTNIPRYQLNTIGTPQILLEPAVTNILNYTETSGNWFSAQFNMQYGATAPDGSFNANIMYINGTGPNMVPGSFSVSSGTTYTASIWLKGTGNSIGKTASVWFYYAGTATGPSNPVFVTLTSTWQRFTTTTTPTGSGTLYFRVDAEGVGQLASIGDVVYAWGAQVEIGSTATSYIPSIETFTGRASTGTYYAANGYITTASSGVARYTYNPTLLTAPSKLMLESQATNSQIYSSDFSYSEYNKQNVTIVLAANTAPDGTLTAQRVVSNTTSVTHLVINSSITVTANTTYTSSIYAKASGYNFLAMRLDSGSTGVSACFDLSQGTISTAAANTASEWSYPSAFISSVGNGWYRCSISATSGRTLTARCIPIINNATSDINGTTYAGDGTSGIYLWGAQFETGYGASSYIPTSASQVTRAADIATSTAQTRAADSYSSSQATRSSDNASMTGTNYSSWANPKQGTWYAEGYQSTIQTGANRAITSTGGYVIEYININGNPALYDNSNYAGPGTTIQSNIKYKTSYSYGSSGLSSYFNNGSTNLGPGTTAYNGININSTAMSIGNHVGVWYLNGSLTKLSYYPVQLSTNQLQNLTK